MIESQALALVVITFVAAIVNGALGYGFSSITVPIALLFLANRVLNPALVLIEVVLNAYVLWNNRDALPNLWRRVMPIVIGLAPGVMLGTVIVSELNPSHLRFGTFLILLPLILVQAAGYRRPIRSERSIGVIFGTGVGVLYSVTTISGPPLAVMLNNQGYAKRDFRAALGVVRLAESTMTAVAYAYVGLFTATSMALIPWIVPSILIGVPIGAIIIQRMRVETFRRICMSFDAYVVAFGMSRLLDELRLVESPAAYLVLVAVAAIDSWLLLRFFSHSVDESTTRLSESGPLSTRDRGLVPTEDAADLARQRDEGERLLKERQPVVTHAATHDRIIRVARHE
jgi:uncharacterized membrane protein YfcA